MKSNMWASFVNHRANVSYCISGISRRMLRRSPKMVGRQCLKKRYMEPQAGIGNAGGDLAFWKPTSVTLGA